MAVPWIVVPCILIEVYRRFRSSFCLHHQGDGLGLTYETSVNFYHTTVCNNPEESHFHSNIFCNFNAFLDKIHSVYVRNKDNHTPVLELQQFSKLQKEETLGKQMLLKRYINTAFNNSKDFLYVI
jgi:hypothetical protein